jgi:hypothetical protein
MYLAVIYANAQRAQQQQKQQQLDSTCKGAMNT